MRLTDRLAAIWRAPELLTEMAVLMATIADQVRRLDAVTNSIADRLRDLRDDLNEQESALASQLDGPIAHLEAIGADETEPVPPAPIPGGGEDPDAVVTDTNPA